MPTASHKNKKTIRTKSKKPAKAVARKLEKAAAKPAPKPKVPAPGKAPASRSATAATPAPPKPTSKPAASKGAKKAGRRSSLLQRRGPNGELLSPGDILLPGGAQGVDEIHYLFRGVVAAEHPAGEAGVQDILARRLSAEDGEKGELNRQLHSIQHRFDSGSIEPSLPQRVPSPRRSFQTVVERAKHRRREIGAFLRGLDIGRTETSHMDSHGEASLHGLMEWAARLENLVEADEPERADYAMFHRGLDQLDSTTEALIIDVELTLRRLRDRNRAS